MDALFDAINVRDLLPAGDLTDQTSPLSAPDLRLLITRLDSHSLQIKSKVQSYLTAHHGDFSSLFQLCNDAVSRTEEINRKVSDLSSILSDTPVDVGIREILEELNRKLSEAKVKKELLQLVNVIVDISERLRGVREAVKSGKLVVAAEELKELKVALRIGDEEDGDPLVYGLLRKEWLACFDEIQDVLVKFMEKAVQLEQESSTVRVRHQLSVDELEGVELKAVLQAMEVVGISDYGLAKVADKMVKFVIAPAMNCSTTTSFDEGVKEISEGLTEAILKTVPSSDFKTEDVDGQRIYSSVLQVVKFISKCICLEKESWVRCFGRLAWPRISELIVSNFLSKVVPKDAANLASFQMIIKNTSEFENALKDLMFISASHKPDLKLSNFAENVEVHFASRKKIEILAKARNFLLHCDFSIPQEYMRKSSQLKNRAGTDAGSTERLVHLLFMSERCVVSTAASQLMALVHQTLKDVCLSSPKVAPEFYRAARDAILLYEAIIPVKLERKLDKFDQAAVLMHNDCLYLSQEILGLAFQYRPDFPMSIKEHAVFVDMAPRFHAMADKILQRQIQLVIHNLKEAIDGANGFQNSHLMQQFESAKFSIDQVVFVLEKVRIIWEPLLLPSTYKKSMCAVLESVLSRITVEILLLDDMAAEETLQLQRLIQLMLEGVSPLLDSLLSAKEKPSEQNSSRRINDLIPSLRKIRKLAGKFFVFEHRLHCYKLLDMPLKSITTDWETGELHRCSFSQSEVVDLIRAIFTDTPLRKECIWRIEDIDL
ncbi:Centromere/kinetochore protein zw10 homolog [Linum grandiflorum]